MEHSETTPGTDERLSDRLSPMQYHCTQEAGTEQAFTGEYWDEKRAGTYRCVVCGEALFDSDTKYDSGSGWPSFWAPLTEGLVDNHQDILKYFPDGDDRERISRKWLIDVGLK